MAPTPSEPLSTPFCPYCGAAIGHTRSCPIKPTGVVGALLAFSDLREALSTIQVPDPHYWHETPPTAADHLHDILEIMDWHLQQIRAYLDAP